jgi:hypothetical protein
MIDLTPEGIHKYCGPIRAGEYRGRIEAVRLSKSIGGLTTWYLHWKLKGVSAVLVDSLTMFSIDRPIASAWHRVAAILAANDRPLLFEHEGQARSALVGCWAVLSIAKAEE